MLKFRWQMFPKTEHKINKSLKTIKMPLYVILYKSNMVQNWVKLTCSCGSISKMVSPLLMSVISQGPPALCTGKASPLVQVSINFKLNKLTSNYAPHLLLTMYSNWAQSGIHIMVFSIQLSSYKLIDHLQATVKKKERQKNKRKILWLSR